MTDTTKQTIVIGAVVREDHDGTKHAVLRDESLAEGTLLVAASAVEDMIAACVPGGSICDPQVVADAIRGYFAAQPAPATGDCDHCGMSGGHTRECPNVDPEALNYEPWGKAPATGDEREATETYLCLAWGETDFPAAAIVTDMEAVRAFLIEQWLGSADETDDDGANLLDWALQDMREQWALEGEAWKWEVQFEIGGVSVRKVADFSPVQASAAHRREVADDEPDMFWNHDDSERCQDSVHNVVIAAYENGCNVGDIVEVQQAIRLHNLKVRIIADAEDSEEISYEVVEDAAAPAHGEPGALEQVASS